MEDRHTDYFLKRISLTDKNRSYRTTKEEFNTPSKTLKEFVREDRDCHIDGAFITYIFGKEENVLGIARMKPISYLEFKKEVLKKKYLI